MGAGASFESSGHIYNAIPCGCIYRCEYQDLVVNRNLALVKCCYHCLEKLKHRTFDYNAVDDMRYEIEGKDVHSVTSNSGWMNQVSALEYANGRGIRSVEEFLYNTNILNKYGFGVRK